MRNVVLILLVVVLSSPMYSQCQLEQHQVDEFTGERIIRTKTERIWALPKEGAFEVTFVAIDSSILMLTQVPVPEVSHSRGHQNSILLFEGSRLELPTVTSEVADFERLSGITFWKQSLNFVLSKDQLEYLTANDITAARFYISDVYREYHINKDKNRRKFQQLAYCLFNSM